MFLEKRRSKRPTSTERERDEDEGLIQKVAAEKIETPKKRGRPRKSRTPAAELEEESPKKKRYTKQSTPSVSPTTPSPRKRPTKKDNLTPEEATTSSLKKITTPSLKLTQAEKEKSAEEDLITINKKELFLNLKSNKRFMNLLEQVAIDFLAEKISEGERVLHLERADTSKSFEEHETPSVSTESKTSTPKKTRTTHASDVEESLPTFDEIGRMIVKDAQVKSAMQNDVIISLISNSKNSRKYTAHKKRESSNPK